MSCYLSSMACHLSFVTYCPGIIVVNIIVTNTHHLLSSICGLSLTIFNLSSLHHPHHHQTLSQSPSWSTPLSSLSSLFNEWNVVFNQTCMQLHLTKSVLISSLCYLESLSAMPDVFVSFSWPLFQSQESSIVGSTTASRIQDHCRNGGLYWQASAITGVSVRIRTLMKEQGPQADDFRDSG